MASLKDLHTLIHSLNKFEKIQVSKNIGQLYNEQKERYNKDYQCIMSFPEWDRKRITAKLKLLKKRANLSESNNYLYNFICDILVSIKQKKDKKLGLIREIQVQEMLFSKGLVDLAENSHKLAIKQSKNLGLDGLNYHLLSLEDRLILNKSKGASKHLLRKQKVEEQINFIDNLKLKLQIQSLKRDFYQLASSIGTPRNQSQLQEYQLIENHPALSNENKHASKEVIYEYYDLKSYLISLYSMKDAYSFLLQGIRSMQKLFDMEVNPRYEFYLTRRSLEFAIMGDLNEYVESSIERLTSFQPYLKNEIHKAELRTKTHWAWLFYYLRTSQLELARAYMDENHQAIVDRATNKLSVFNYFNLMFCARICFLLKDYSKSLSYIKILLTNDVGIRKTLISHIQCLLLLNHYKLGNTEYLPYGVRSLYRTLLKQKQLYAPEKELISFLRKTTSRVDLKAQLKKLYSKLKVLEQDPFNRSFFGNGDYLKWLEEEIK